VFENRVLRRTFEIDTDKETRCWRKLNNNELNNQHSSPLFTSLTLLELSNQREDGQNI
jgi:hypothetical protein